MVSTPPAGSVRVGCSGWMYDDWRGVVYPADLPKREWLPYYATLFDTVELNTTFYRLPSATAVDGWRDAVPPGFLFAAKLGAFGTHRKKLREPEWWLPNHLERIARLGPTLGPTLAQLPPRWKRNAGRLDEFLAQVPDDQRWAVEVRDPSWLHDEVLDVLRRHQVALCIHDLVPDHPWELTTGWTYVRFHGPNALDQPYVGPYGPDRLRPAADRLAGWVTAGVDVYAYFNNDYDGHAVRDAQWLRSAMVDAGPASQ